ncbi:DUF2851 family protein [Zhouia sp. PK063]|uniref:DUF2851 family protein n=1 Tax=Zhouia sp. PK063 TaxID=3373602 RepID=UPI0037B075C4
MKEDFLHFLWKYKRFSFTNLQTTDGEELHIYTVGTTNHNAGPDFFNAKIEVANQVWIGNVEVHIKSSDWLLHQHHNDLSYENVILHVVWQHDENIFHADGTKIPTLELKNYVSNETLNAYKKLYHQPKKFIPCENQIAQVDSFIKDHWLDRLFIDRLETKSHFIHQELKNCNNDWEAVTFKLLLKNFGLKVNAEAFASITNYLPFEVFRKYQHQVFQLEALLFGVSGLLNDDVHNEYFIRLKNEYNYLKHKHEIHAETVVPPKFLRLRPFNFPTIRLSQFAQVYKRHAHLFSKLMSLKSLQDGYDLFAVETTEFWQTHYTFKKESDFKIKTLSHAFTDLLLINTILPLQFCYAKYNGAETVDFTSLATDISAEKNRIITSFSKIGIKSTSAKNSQALLQLYHQYCEKKNCLKCTIGNKLLKQ